MSLPTVGRLFFYDYVDFILRDSKRADNTRFHQSANPKKSTDFASAVMLRGKRTAANVPGQISEQKPEYRRPCARAFSVRHNLMRVRNCLPA